MTRSELEDRRDRLTDLDFGGGDFGGCKPGSRARDFVKSQAKMAAALRDGQRQLIRQPAATSDESYERFSGAEARRVGLAVLDGRSGGAV